MERSFISREIEMLNKVTKKMEDFLDIPESDFFDEMNRNSETLLNYAKTLEILYKINVNDVERMCKKQPA